MEVGEQHQGGDSEDRDQELLEQAYAYLTIATTQTDAWTTRSG